MQEEWAQVTVGKLIVAHYIVQKNAGQPRSLRRLAAWIDQAIEAAEVPPPKKADVQDPAPDRRTRIFVSPLELERVRIEDQKDPSQMYQLQAWTGSYGTDAIEFIEVPRV